MIAVLGDISPIVRDALESDTNAEVEDLAGIEDRFVARDFASCLKHAALYYQREDACEKLAAADASRCAALMIQVCRGRSNLAALSDVQE